MKKTHIIFLISMITHMLTGMEGQPPFLPLTSVYNKLNTQGTTVVSVQEISKIINKKYTSNAILDMFNVPNLAENDMLTICIMVKDSHKISTITNTFLKKLYNENYFFKRTIDYFTDKAHNALKNVTSASLDTIQHPTAYHPAIKLNELPLEIKKYVMSTAQKNIKHEYFIPFEGIYNLAINCYDICPATDMLAVGIDEAIIIHSAADLTKREYLPMTGQPQGLSFNSDGSLIAVIASDQSKARDCINIYDTTTKKLLSSTVSTMSFLYYVHFLYQTSQNMLSVIGNNKNNSTTVLQMLYSLDIDGNAHLIGTLPLIKEILFKKIIKKGSYRLGPMTPNNQFSVMKKSLALFLCSQVVTNTNNIFDLNNIVTSQTYNQLTTHEKSMLFEAINERKKILLSQQQTFKKFFKKENTEHLQPPQPQYYYPQVPFVYQATNMSPFNAINNPNNPNYPLYYQPPMLIQQQQYIQSSNNNGSRIS